MPQATRFDRSAMLVATGAGAGIGALWGVIRAVAMFRDPLGLAALRLPPFLDTALFGIGAWGNALLVALVAFGAGLLYAALASRPDHGLSRSRIAAGGALSAVLGTVASGLFTILALIVLSLLAYDMPSESERDPSGIGQITVFFAVVGLVRTCVAPVLSALPGALGGWLFALFNRDRL